jgi:Cu/Ag efflux protein CusF
MTTRREFLFGATVGASMKNRIKLFTILICSVAVFALACTKNANIATNTVEKQIYKAVGVVKKIDAANDKITVDHEDIKGYMPAMEMDFSVIDKSLIESSKIGDKVDFEIERTGEKLVITKLSKIGEVAVLNGAEIYKTNCASCHNEKGEGTKKGISLVTGHALHHTEAEHIKQVTDGEAKKMPAFRDKLTAEQIAEAVKFVRDDLQKKSKREESHKHKH